MLITSWIVLSLIFLISFLGNRNLKSIPEGLQNVTEYVTEFIRDLAKTQIGEDLPDPYTKEEVRDLKLNKIFDK